jgi:hypothetical protein
MKRKIKSASLMTKEQYVSYSNKLFLEYKKIRNEVVDIQEFKRMKEQWEFDYEMEKHYPVPMG